MEELLYRILLYVLIGSLSILCLAITCYLINKISIRKTELRLREYDLNISADTGDQVFGLLDKIIQECFNEYTVLNIEYHDDIKYINDELEKIITQEVAHKVVDRISPALMSKISLVYNMSNFDKLLSERVYLFTMQYAIEKNSIKNKE